MKQTYCTQQNIKMMYIYNYLSHKIKQTFNYLLSVPSANVFYQSNGNPHLETN